MFEASRVKERRRQQGKQIRRGTWTEHSGAGKICRSMMEKT
jgi:hypothetical protein